MNNRLNRQILQCQDMASLVSGPSSPAAVESLRHIEDVDDPSVAEFKTLKDKIEIRKGKFISEGPETIRLLLRNKLGIRPTKLLLKPASYERLKVDISESCYRDDFEVLIMRAKLMAKLVGFKGCRGTLACGLVPDNSFGVEDLFKNTLREDMSQWRILAIDGCNNTANFGSMIRSASCFGIHAIVISKDCCDQFYRQTIRVSMGHVFNIPIVRVDDLSLVLEMLHQRHEVQSFAAVIDNDATLLHTLNAPLARRYCIVLGNEDHGVSENVRVTPGIVRLRIGMAPNVDSLSINNATAILLFGLKEREAKPGKWD